MTQLYVYFIIILLLATSFGIIRLSQGQHLQKNLKLHVYRVQKVYFMGSHLHSLLVFVIITVDPRVTTGLTYEQFGLRPKLFSFGLRPKS
jgi:hypothetical protein